LDQEMTNSNNSHTRAQNKTEEQVYGTLEAARAGVEKLADFRLQATESAWKSMQSGVDAASQGVQNASDQFARTLGFTGEDSERLARQSAQNVEAITKCGSVLSQALQETSRQWYALAQRQWQRNLTGVSQLAHCRSGQDFVAIQSVLVREGLAQMVEDSRSIAETSLRAVNEASKAIAGTAQGNAAQGRSGALAA